MGARRGAAWRVVMRLGASVLIGALLLGIAACGASGAPPAHSSAATATSHRSEIGFRNESLLEEHYEKHGREFGDVSRGEYLRIAQQLRDRPAGGDVLEIVRDDGVVSRYDRKTGTFIAFDEDGVIRTCFRPNDGERYFRRQAMRRERGR